ncbi:putative membrane protein [Hypnocyclicus thermotrophus]|uniref:Membrane protein n=1 Tax=Hypnocyclicus thermotrophus TaxID=1627895 RepID=A0AA46DZ24_9FUSO|nr:exopolysaccharide Pel transporter PelG [Hypnocyclicus thermotrophus]TDT71433.1 putative membrane protein [Hypnocyclicus thermotrophus]
MAGIGFELKKMFGKDDTLTKRVKAYTYSTFVSAGPWIITILVLNIFSIISNSFFSELVEKSLFMGSIVYSFIFSQIITTPWQMLITRYISDELYIKRYSNIKASFIGLTKIVIILSFLTGYLYYLNKDIPYYYKYISISLLVITSLTWIIMVFLSSIKNYKSISNSFILGGTIAIILEIIFLKYPINFVIFKSSTNMLFAYTIGMFFTYMGLVYSFFNTFSEKSGKQFDFIRYLSKFPSIFFIGLFYILGLWIDDILIWFSFLGINIKNIFRFSPLYDTAIFWAYFITIPSYVLFVIKMEVSFYDKYKKYFSLISHNGNLDDIESARKDMKTTLYKELIHLFEIQTIITITAIVLVNKVVAIFNLPLLLVQIFKISALGSLCNVFILIIILIMLYFEYRKQALFIAFLFLFFNTFFTLIFIPFGSNFFGAGYFIATFTTLIIALILLVYSLKEINYYTFFRQPIFSVIKKNNFNFNGINNIILKFKTFFSNRKVSLITLILLGFLISYSAIVYYDPDNAEKRKQDLITKLNIFLEKNKPSVILGRERKNLTNINSGVLIINNKNSNKNNKNKTIIQKNPIIFNTYNLSTKPSQNLPNELSIDFKNNNLFSKINNDIDSNEIFNNTKKDVKTLKSKIQEDINQKNNLIINSKLSEESLQNNKKTNNNIKNSQNIQKDKKIENNIIVDSIKKKEKNISIVNKLYGYNTFQKNLYYDEGLNNIFNYNKNNLKFLSNTFLGLNSNSNYLYNRFYLEYIKNNNIFGYKNSFSIGNIGESNKLSVLKEYDDIFLVDSLIYRDLYSVKNNDYGNINTEFINSLYFINKNFKIATYYSKENLYYFKNFTLKYKFNNNFGVFYIPRNLINYFYKNVFRDIDNNSKFDDGNKDEIIFAKEIHNKKYNLGIYNYKFLHFIAYKNTIASLKDYIFYIENDFLNKSLTTYYSENYKNYIYLNYNYDSNKYFINNKQFYNNNVYSLIEISNNNYNFIYNLGKEFVINNNVDINLGIGNTPFYSVWDSWRINEDNKFYFYLNFKKEF